MSGGSDPDDLYLRCLGVCAIAWGGPACHGVIRSRPADFVVEEVLGFEPDGEGDHTLLRIRKTDANTDWVARQLARRAGVPARDVGFCGLKDRHAVTTQWFSIPGRPRNELESLSAAGIEVLEQVPHRRKLRRGAHRGNRFRLVLRELEGDPDLIGERLARIATGGVPNYFGEQRFGRNGSNLGLARALAAGARLDRRRRSFALSAARSAIFNLVLSGRVEDGSWDQLSVGDLAMIDGTGSWFPVEAVDDDIRGRIACMALHPTGPLWGRGDPPSAGDVRALERSVAESCPELTSALDGANMDHDRRALRLAVRDLEWQLADDSLEIRFGLSRGGFATAVLRELMVPLAGR